MQLRAEIDFRRQDVCIVGHEENVVESEGFGD
jgi:hypothetical protein